MRAGKALSPHGWQLPQHSGARHGQNGLQCFSQQNEFTRSQKTRVCKCSEQNNRQEQAAFGPDKPSNTLRHRRKDSESRVRLKNLPVPVAPPCRWGRRARSQLSDQPWIKREGLGPADEDPFEVGMSRIEKVVWFVWDYDAGKSQHCRTGILYPNVTYFLRR
jgi:hypothetical protein